MSSRLCGWYRSRACRCSLVCASMVPVVHPANRPKGVARAAARLTYDTRAGSSLRPCWLSGSFCQTSRASSRLGEATKSASRGSGRATSARSRARSLARSRSRAASRPWGSPSEPTASSPSLQATISSNGNNGVRRTKNPDGVNCWPALSRSVIWRAGIRPRGRNQEHPVPGGLDGCGRSQQHQGDPGGSVDQLDAGPRPRSLGRVLVSLHPRGPVVSRQTVEVERALEPVHGGTAELRFPGGLVYAVVEVGQSGCSVAEAGVDDSCL